MSPRNVRDIKALILREDVEKTQSWAAVNVVGTKKKKRKLFFTPKDQNIWQNIVNVYRLAN